MIFTPFAFMASQAAGGDPDAQAYINKVEATGVTLSTTIKDALDVFYTGLKTDGLYSKMAWMYPFLGGTANAHAIEGIDPTNINTQLTWFGTVTHTSTGTSTIGANGYGLPNISPADVHSDVNAVTIGGYIWNTQTNDEGALIGDGIGNNTRYQLTTPFSGNDVGVGIGQGVYADYTNPTGPPDGRWIGSRTASNLITLYKNGLSVATNTTNTSSGTLNTNPFALFYIKYQAFYFNAECGFVFGANGFDGTEVANFDSRLTTYLTAIGR